MNGIVPPRCGGRVLDPLRKFPGLAGKRRVPERSPLGGLLRVVSRTATTTSSQARTGRSAEQRIRSWSSSGREPGAFCLSIATAWARRAWSAMPAHTPSPGFKRRSTLVSTESAGQAERSRASHPKGSLAAANKGCLPNSQIGRTGDSHSAERMRMPRSVRR